ncbi:MAG: hypothetical protein WDN06_11785 [Asticcacaulis sp.]
MSKAACTPDDKGKPMRSSIDLFNTHTNLLSDQSNSYELKLGYDDKDKEGKNGDDSFFLRLEGFTYERFRHYRDEESLGVDESERRHRLRQALNRTRNVQKLPAETSPRRWLPVRLRWLNLQYTKRKPGRDNYNSDPYNTLYSFYKRMGAPFLADRVLREKLHTERIVGDPFQKVFFAPYEWLLGYGLRPIRSTAIYLFFVISLAATVWKADHIISISVERPWLSSIPSGNGREPSMTGAEIPRQGDAGYRQPRQQHGLRLRNRHSSA